ncbi:hypothetical protein VNO78_23257 [Psophocarpus tetragonolobus]|uniref:Uncharacterized protein n=1 Tax=Psophocarpus tetragonolobus TaxID=3891 RepID=A0AAN9XDV5_PSOTE
MLFICHTNITSIQLYTHNSEYHPLFTTYLVNTWPNCSAGTSISFLATYSAMHFLRVQDSLKKGKESCAIDLRR